MCLCENDGLKLIPLTIIIIKGSDLSWEGITDLVFLYITSL